MNNPSVLVAVLVALLVAVVNLAGHFIPWAVIPCMADAQGRLRRLLAYAYGTLSIWLGMGVWYLVGWTDTPVSMLTVLTAVIGAAGLGTVMAYLIDLLREHQALKGDVADYEQTDRS